MLVITLAAVASVAPVTLARPAPAARVAVPMPMPVPGPLVRVARPGGANAAMVRASITARSALTIRSTKSATLVMGTGTVPGIKQVDGRRSGVFEPGADHAITGTGFGRKGGYAFLRVGATMMPMTVKNWSDELIIVRLSPDISGIADLSQIELAVAPEGKPAFKWSRFGFRAARADVTLPIAADAVRSDRGRGVYTTEGDNMTVTRRISDTAEQKKCIEPGIDRIRWNVPLRAGFEVTGYGFSHVPHRNTSSETPRGRYAARWEGDDLRIDYGVTRFYDPPGMWRSATGACWSSYSVRLIATGPRGLSPLP